MLECHIDDQKIKFMTLCDLLIEVSNIQEGVNTLRRYLTHAIHECPVIDVDRKRILLNELYGNHTPTCKQLDFVQFEIHRRAVRKIFFGYLRQSCKTLKFMNGTTLRF